MGATLSAAYPKGEYELRHTAFGDNSILAEEADIVAPCGFGASLNEKTIPSLRCKIVCGAANNQLADPAHGDAAIGQMGICYVRACGSLDLSGSARWPTRCRRGVG